VASKNQYSSLENKKVFTWPAWYLLATLYGVPEEVDQKLQAKNRAAWTRYFAAGRLDAIQPKLF
jgi:hypothetical protein